MEMCLVEGGVEEEVEWKGWESGGEGEWRRRYSGRGWRVEGRESGR